MEVSYLSMSCFECGNCKQDEQLYYCIAKNEFVIREKVITFEKKERNGWKKGDSQYESHRRRNRQDKIHDII